MSADNGIYILKTKDQYRIIHAFAIDNLWWSFEDFNQRKEMVSARLVEYFGKQKYTRNAETAMKVALAMQKTVSYTEYGIVTLPINKTWNRIVEEGVAQIPLEIKNIQERNKDERWSSEIKNLKEIMVLYNSN